MPVAVCPSCSTRLRVPDGRAGKAKCPKCGGGVPLAPVEVLPDIEVEEPAAPAAACPFCREEVKPGARKCKHCGETLDPALRAAQEAERAARRLPRDRDRDRDDDNDRRATPPPRQRSVLGGCVALLAVVAALAGVGFLVVTRQQRSDLNEGTRLWDAGQRDDAVAKYKAGFPAAGAEKPGVVKRIVEHELARGDAKEAAAWVEKGLAEGLDVPYAEHDAVALLEQAKRDRAARAAQAAQKEADDAKQAEDRARGVRVTADQLRQEFAADAKAAEGRYKGRRVRVTGALHEAIAPEPGNPITDAAILALAPNAQPWVWCRFPAGEWGRLRTLRPGQAVAVRGRCEGFFFGEVRLADCSLEP